MRINYTKRKKKIKNVAKEMLYATTSYNKDGYPASWVYSDTICGHVDADVYYCILFYKNTVHWFYNDFIVPKLNRQLGELI